MTPSIHQEIAALQALDIRGLCQRWEEVFGRPSPKRARRDLLLRALAWQVQARMLGGITPAVRRRLARIAEDVRAGETPSVTPASVKPGTRLLRQWHGITHEVIVLEDGVRYRDRTWRSLSAVARDITGTRWSGPRFFGLKADRHVQL